MKVFNAGNPSNPAIFREPIGIADLEGWEGPLPPVESVLLRGPAAIDKRLALQKRMSKDAVRRAVILVHGFNSSKERVEKVYAEIARKFYEDPGYQVGTEVVGFRWPSDGSALAYFADLRDAHIAAKTLHNLAVELRQVWGAQEIHIVAHSMGCEVALAAAEMCTDTTITTLTLLGGDVKAADMAHGGKWAGLANTLRTLHCYYSASDNVLGFWARLIPGRGFRRLGQIGLPSGCPRNFYNWNAEDLQGSDVYHDTYRSSDKIIHAIQYNLGTKG